MSATEVIPTTADAALLAARHALRDLQSEAVSAKAVSDTDISVLALRQLGLQTRFYPTDDPHRVRRGNFSYHREIEEERIQRAREIVRRVQPTGYEDPNYFALLAYQAASIEMALPDRSDLFPHYMIGTIHKGKVNAFSDRVRHTDFNLAILHSGFVELAYQFAKAVVEAISPLLAATDQARVEADLDLDRIKEALQTNRAPSERVSATLRHYLYQGYPRAVELEQVLDEHGPVLSPLISLTERWALAHEYGHGVAYDHDFAKAPHPQHAEEYFADDSATIITVQSAARLDGLPPEIALGSAIFALCSLEMCRRAYCIATRGEQGEDIGDLSHPPNHLRADHCIATFRRYFDVQYGKREFDLQFVLREETPAKHNFSTERADVAYRYGNILLATWPFVKDDLLAEFKSGRRLHEIWE